jgi:tetratricopeptide (TPR) repeat protein
MNTPGPITRRFYNPGWLGDDAIESGFIVRRELLGFFRDELARTAIGGSAQHYLLIGARGSGKTTLLQRLAVAMRRDTDLSDHLIALSFPEELYQVKCLSDFWWVACDSLQEELVRIGYGLIASEIATDIEKSRPRQVQPDDDSGLRLLLTVCARIRKRPVLLVDNFDLVLQRIDKRGRKLNDPQSTSYWALREALSMSGSPVVIGSSVRLTEPFVQYDTAFYDFFVPSQLGRLSLADVNAMLAHLAKTSPADHVLTRLKKRRGRVRALYDLTGGNPRAVGMVFDLLRQAPEGRAVEDFEHLMDLTTPYYKSRLEELSEQAQIVMHALALCLRKATAAEIAQQAGLETRTVSAQLDVLERAGLVEKGSGRGRVRYSISEQLFRLWLQVRSGARFRQPVIYLAEFLEAFYDAEELERSAPKAHFSEPAGIATDARRSLVDAQRASLKYAPSERDEALGAAGLSESQIELLRATQARGLMCLPFLTAAESEAAAAGMNKPQLLEIAWRLFIGGFVRARTAAAACDWVSFGKMHAPHADPDQWAACSAALRQGRWIDAAELAVLEALRGRPSARVWLEQGILSILQSRSSKDSELALRRSIELNCNDPDAWYHLGTVLADQPGRLGEAEEALRRAIALDPDDGYGWYELGALLSGVPGRELEAERAFHEALRLKPGSPYFWYDLGRLLFRQGARYADAEIALRKSIALEPGLVYPWYELGNLLTRGLGRFAEAEQAYRKALECRPDAPYVWYALGLLQTLHLGQTDAAEVSLRRAIELVPDDSDFWNTLGGLLTQVARYSEAEAAFRRAIELNPKRAEPWNGLGIALLDDDLRLDEAERAYRKAIELEPGNDRPWFNLGTLLSAVSGRDGEAEFAYRKAFEIDPESPFVAESLERLRRRRSFKIVVAGMERNDWATVRSLLSELVATSGIDWHAVADAGFAEDVMAHAVAKGNGVRLLDLLRELAFEKIAAPLMLALKACVAQDRGHLSSASPEIQSAAELLFARLLEALAKRN